MFEISISIADGINEAQIAPSIARLIFNRIFLEKSS